MASEKFSASPRVVLWALVAAWLLFGHVVDGGGAGRVRARRSNSIAFPGFDAFGVISGLRKNSSSSPTTTRPTSNGGGNSSRYPPTLPGGSSSAASVAPAQSASPECAPPSFDWFTASPFYGAPTIRHEAGTLLDVRAAVDAMFRLSTRFESLLRDPSGTNLLHSPVGLASALGQLALAARGRTRQQLLDILLAPGGSGGGCGENGSSFHSSFRTALALLWSRRGSESHELSVRNALFHQATSQGNANPPLDADFAARLASHYATEIFPTDFRTSPIYAQQQVNLWALKASHGKIDQLMPHIPPRTTTAVLSSVIYFRAKWENQFNKQFTIKKSFFLDGDYRGRTKMVDFMSNELELPYVESQALGCKMVVLPYLNNETAMYLIMPLGSSFWKHGPTRPMHPLPVAPPEPVATPSGTRAPRQANHRMHFENNGHLQSMASSSRSNRWRRKRRPQGAEQSRGTNGCSEGVGEGCRRQQQRPDDFPEGQSPFSAVKLHELAARLGAREFNALAAQAARSPPARVSLFLPRLTMASNVRLREALAALGADSIFGDAADFSGAVVGMPGAEMGGARWAVDEVWQQSRLEVTEEGTEAASGTAAVIIDYSLDSATFKANSPFLAIIRHEATGVPVFWASVANPS